MNEDEAKELIEKLQYAVEYQKKCYDEAVIKLEAVKQFLKEKRQ